MRYRRSEMELLRELAAMRHSVGRPLGFLLRLHIAGLLIRSLGTLATTVLVVLVAGYVLIILIT